MVTKATEIIANWFLARDWKQFPFQEEVAQHYLNGKSGLLNAPTGSGKTYALFLPVLMEWLNANPDFQTTFNNGLQLIWITPLRALSKDISKAMQTVCDELSIPWRIEFRTGDTTAAQRAKQKKNMPEVLITTPESLHLLIASKDNRKFFKNLKCIVADEWHELLGNKRGVQTELAFSRLKGLNPNLKVWGISATIGNLDEALHVLLGNKLDIKNVATVKADIDKQIEVKSILPNDVSEMPWSGHLGIQLLDKIIPVIYASRTTLVFTNTRAQCEIWYQNLLNAEPDLAGQIAMHHGSIDREVREWVENALAKGSLKAVVCTSSLDLGIDFWPVETVIQIGGPKGVARFSQRAGRSGHKPGEKSVIYFVPTHTLELIEAAALKEALKTGYFESRIPIVNAIDVLTQYAVTVSVGEGMNEKQIFEEVKNTFAYNNLTKNEWQEILNFITTGGKSLNKYDEFSKVQTDEKGIFRIADRKKAMRHRLQIGTIVGNNLLSVKYQRGKKIGSVEEYFVSKLAAGDTFWFAGRALEIVRIEGMTVSVKNSTKNTKQIPHWGGGRMSFSSQLSEIFRKKLSDYAKGIVVDEELHFLKPLLDIQEERSAIPKNTEFLIEYSKSKDGHHYFFYPFEGRMTNEGLAALFAFRISKIKKASYSVAMNDYGFELLTDEVLPLKEAIENELFNSENLFEDIQKSINATEMARRTFRDIAVISGMVFKGMPGKIKKGRHLQASSQLIFDVLNKYEPNNLLLKQAFKEVYENQVDEVRMRVALKRIQKQKIIFRKTEIFSPFAFPIMADRLRTTMTTESLKERIKKMSLGK